MPLFRRVCPDDSVGYMETPRLILPSDFTVVGSDRRSPVDLCRKGELHRVRRGAYIRTADWKRLRAMQQYELQATAVQLAARHQPVLAHATAAALWGLWLVGTPTLIHVMTEVTTGGHNSNDVRQHRGSLTDGVIQCGPFRLTDKLTTVMQLIVSLDFPRAVAVCDSSLKVFDRQRAYNSFGPIGAAPGISVPIWQTTYMQGPPLRQEELQAAAEMLPSKAAALRAQTVINFASELSGSAGESMSRAKMHMFGFPTPVLQKKYLLRDSSTALVDFWFEELNLVGEFDGKEKYLRVDWAGGASIQDRIMQEKDRENQIRAQGVGFVRWTWAEMLNKERFIRLLKQVGLRQQ